MTNETELPPPFFGEMADNGMAGDRDRAASSPVSTGAPPDASALKTLCRDLADAMYIPAAGPDMLRRQAYLLDQILYLLMENHVNDRLASGKYVREWLDTVLALQKQSMDTVKAAEAAEYMKAIAPRRFPAVPAPPPRDSGKQKEGFE